MKKESCILLLLLTACCFSYAQTTITNVTVKRDGQLNESSIVMDAYGNHYAYEDWTKLMQTGNYRIKKDTAKGKTGIYIISRLTPEGKQALIEAAPRPKESEFFVTGTKFEPFKTKDINGTKINLKDLAGKVIVLNFWFINCPPCRTEIPDLNELVKFYGSDTNTVFIAIALDSRRELKDFLKQMPFDYNIIDDGQFLANRYGIKAYPTNVVVDGQGIIRFHSSGYSIATAYWIKKAIGEAKGQQP